MESIDGNQHIKAVGLIERDIMSNFITKQFYKQRSDFEESCVERDKKFTFPSGVDYTKDIAYADDNNKAHRLDIYRPQDRAGQVLPVVINVHGGGLLLGNKEFNKYFCALLSLKGYLVYSIEYQLIPDCTIYDQFKDVFMAMDYIKGRIISDNGDMAHVYMAGDSGGACLITYVNAIQNNDNIAKAAGVTPSDLHINALALISGMFYTSRFDKIGMCLPTFLYGKKYKKSPFGKYVNPENKELVDALAPVWMVTSHDDYLRKYTINFEKALADAGKEHELVDFEANKSLTHAFSVFEPFLPESGQVLDLIAEYLRKY